MKISKSGLSLGISQNKGTETIQPIFFSSFLFPLLAFYVASFLPSQAFLILIFFFLLLSSTFFSLCPSDLNVSIFWYFLPVSVLKFLGRWLATDPWRVWIQMGQ